MTTGLVPFPIFRAFDANGTPLAGGLLYTYQAGTTTPQVTFTDSTGGTPNTNPVVLDSTGSASIWLGSAAYKFVLYDSSSNVQWSSDNIQSPNITFGASSITAAANTQLTNPLNTMYTVVFTTTGKSLYLPAANTPNSIQKGLPFYFYNNGSNSFKIVAQDLTTVITTIPPGGFTELILTSNATTNGTYTVVPIPGAGAFLSFDTNGNLQVNLGAGLQSDGSDNIEISPTAVTPGTYLNANVTVEQDGRLTLASAGTVPRAFIAGCLLTAITGNHTTAAISVGAGLAVDSTNAAYIASAGYSWLASNGNAINGTDASSSTLANSTTYHMFLCSGASGTGTFCSASLTPTLPTGYAVSKRRIGSFLTDSSGNPLPYTSIEKEGGAVLNYLTTQIQDIAVTSLVATSRTLFALSVPTGIKVQPIIRVASNSGSPILITSPDESDVAAPGSGATVPAWDVLNTNGETASVFVTTNTSGQIAARGQTGTSTFYGNTRGWVDFRRT